MHSLGMLLFLTLLCLAVGQIGAFFTTEESYHWFHALNKPTWTPPIYITPIIWTVVYLLMALSAWLIFRLKKAHYRIALFFWCIQLVLNAFWIPLFFGNQEALYGLIIISILWALVFITTLLFYRISRLAGFFMLTYLSWITFMGILNFKIWALN
jgi:benzodiazapine receptor